MKPVKKTIVLIALDYNPTAEKVAEAGFSFAKKMKADVLLLHVISDPINYSLPEHVTIMGFAGFMGEDSVPLISSSELKKESQHFLDKSKLHLGDKAIQTMVKEGDIAESILKAAKSKHADFIVMGTHSRKWLENIIMGSVAEKILRYTTIPLIVIPTKKQK